LRAGLLTARRMGMNTNVLAFLQSLCEVHQARGEMDALLATAQEAWAPPLGPPPGLLAIMFRSAFVQAHAARGEWDAAAPHAHAVAESLIALAAPLRLQIAVYLPLELFALIGDRATPARLRTEFAADLAQGDPENVQAQRLHFVRFALASGDAVAARQELDAMPPLATIETTAQRSAWQVAEAAILLAEGHADAALAALPGEEVELDAELQARACAVQVRAEPVSARGSGPAAVSEARRLLARPDLHALAARVLRDSLAADGLPPTP
jgi:hypothetical protein